jgi:hypothetical protein
MYITLAEIIVALSERFFVNSVRQKNSGTHMLMCINAQYIDTIFTMEFTNFSLFNTLVAAAHKVLNIYIFIFTLLLLCLPLLP